jgi:uncharacterized protein (DUF169 family)
LIFEENRAVLERRGQVERTIDLSIFERFKFEHRPVGIKYLLAQPPGIRRSEKELAFCEMLKEAQEAAHPFYVTRENHECKAGPMLLGMMPRDPVFESGQVGARLGVYEDPRANRRVYAQVPWLNPGTVNYVVFAPLHQISFDPDVLILTATPAQAEVLLRAHGYRTGKGWNAKGSSVMGCAWLYIYPYVSAELNFLITGLHHGMRARNVFREGLFLISIPFDLLQHLVGNLQDMPWDLPQYSWGKEAHIKKMKEIGSEIQKALGID